MMRYALCNGRVLTATGIVDNRVLLVADGRIQGLVPTEDPRCHQAIVEDLGGQLLLPGFIDTQVNGGGGVLFNDRPDLEAIRTIGTAHRRYGTTGFLPTLISGEAATITRAAVAVRAAMEAGVPGVLGIHIEGPFLNSKRKGVHDATKFVPLDDQLVTTLCAQQTGRTLITLAPELATPTLIQRLTAAGIIVAAGHTDATFAQINGAINAGLRGFTHLFNAMSPLGTREPGAVGAALYDSNTWCGLIVDGHHVDPVTLKLALRCKRSDRFILVTDAMPTVGTADTSFVLQGQRIDVLDGVCRDQRGTLAGSALTMAGAVRNAMHMLDLSLEQAARMASEFPAQYLGLGHELGRIAPGYRADLVLVDAQINVLRTWIDGKGS